jgi:DNA polymerase-3 subunit alpha
MVSEFVHLHCHTDGSLLDGMGKIDEYLEKVIQNNQKGLGISDHGNVTGIYELIKKARSAGVLVTPGCEFYVAPQNPDGAKAQRPIFYGPNGQKADQYDVSSNGAYTHQTIFAINNEGLKNLFKLSTLSFDPSRNYSKPRIDFELLADHSEGLVAFTGCPSSEISTRFLLGQDNKAYEYANRLKEVFGDRLFVEIMNHQMKSPIERLLLPKQMELSRKLGIQLVATNDAHYTNQEDHVHHEEMLCSQSGASMNDRTWDEGGNRFAFDGTEFYLKTSQEMEMIFPPRDYPNALTNTLLITEMAQDISLSYDPTLKPKSIVPSGHTNVTYFRELIEKGFEERYGNFDRKLQEEARKRIEKEFEVIYSSDFIGYFLTVHEYINWTRDKFSLRDEENNILALSVGVGRGSVGGSIVAYLLKISELDPIRHDLIFERFLSAGRGDTYEITYNDGTTETVVVSDKKTVEGKEKYIHELVVGDTVDLMNLTAEKLI